MSLEITGKVVARLDTQSGESANGPWVKREFVLEYMDGEYAKQACFNVWGEDKVAIVGQMKQNDSVTVSFNVESREYNNKYYTDLRAWKIQNLTPREKASPSNSTTKKEEVTDDLPF